MIKWFKNLILRKLEPPFTLVSSQEEAQCPMCRWSTTKKKTWRDGTIRFNCINPRCDTIMFSRDTSPEGQGTARRKS
jgi:hypothetical protein